MEVPGGGRELDIRNMYSDRLSNLPDCMLIEILSLLKAREITQTCILSKEWKNLWASVPCLHFDFAEFLTEKALANWQNPYLESLDMDLEGFKNFVSSFLNFRTNGIDIDKFHLRCDVSWYELVTTISRAASAWIHYALQHKPKNLHIMLKVPSENIHLPECLFTCKSLKNVYLDIVGRGRARLGNYKIKPKIVFLPNLTTLNFSNLTIKDSYMEKILSGCPALKILSLDGCDMKMNNVISFQTVVSLSVESCRFLNKSGPQNCSISAPNLEYFDLSEKINLALNLKDMSKVTKAKFSITVDGNYNLELLNSLSGVEDLEFVYPWLLGDVLLEELPKCKIFNNLKTLTLGECCMYCNIGPIRYFLAHCPNLENLTLLHNSYICQQNNGHDEIDQHQYLEEQNEMFDCDRLKLINVEYYSWDHDVEHTLAQLLLQSTSESVQILATRRD